MDNKLFTKNFSLLIAGQASSLFGNCILDFALSMYVLEVTGSATVFAGFISASILPTILLSPLGGVLADRADKRTIMVVLDLLSAIVIFLAAVMLDHGNNLLVIGVTLILLSILGAFETPTTGACVPQMQHGDNIVRGNAVVNQVNAISAFTAPFIGSLLYTAFGLKPVMFAGAACFFATALLECFISLAYTPSAKKESFLTVIKNDIADSTRFICIEKPCIFKTLLLVTVVSFFIQGIASIGFPYMIRSVLQLSANYYGAGVSILSLANILGSIAAGLLAAKFETRKLYLALVCTGLSLLPIGLMFMTAAGIYPKYIALILFFCIIQIAACIFSIFALSIIQRLTPDHMIGKVMAYTATFSLCSQPLGQIIYGMLFDQFSHMVYVILIPAGIILSIIGCCSRHFFLDTEQQISDN